MLKCTVFIFSSIINTYAAQSVTYNPYQEVYEAFVQDKVLDKNQTANVSESIHGLTNNNVLIKTEQTFQKSFLYKPITALRFKEVRKCSYSLKDIVERKKQRTILLQSFNQDAVRPFNETDTNTVVTSQNTVEELSKTEVFQYLLTLDEFQDEHFEDEDYESLFQDALNNTLKKVKSSQKVYTALVEWKNIIKEEECKINIRNELLLATASLSTTTIAQRLQFLPTLLLLMGFTYTAIQTDSPLTLLSGSVNMTLNTTGMDINPLNNSWNATTDTILTPQFGSASWTTYCLTTFMAFLSLPSLSAFSHQLHYMWAWYWHSIDIECVTNDLITILYDETKKLKERDFEYVLKKTTIILPELLKGGFPHFSVARFNDEYRKKISIAVKEINILVPLS
jgi:hypothetical protein